MPRYDYQCVDCGEIYEVRATIKEKEAGLVLVCPKCGSHKASQRLTIARLLRAGPDFDSSPPVCNPNARPGCCG